MYTVSKKRSNKDTQTQFQTFNLQISENLLKVVYDTFAFRDPDLHQICDNFITQKISV